MKKYKIYCLKDPNTLEIRYIGVTINKLNKRLSQHWYCANSRNLQTYVYKWIRSIGEKPIIELIEECNESNWENREIYWISHYDNLTNHQKGGSGIVINRDKTSIERSAEAHYKKVVQLDNNGNLIHIFKSIKEATNYFNGKSLSNICNVLNPKYNRSKAYGYYWAYYNDYIQNKHVMNHRKFNYKNIKKVFLYNLNWNLIAEYKSLNLLKDDIGCAYTSARKALKNKRKLYKKYYILNYKI